MHFVFHRTMTYGQVISEKPVNMNTFHIKWKTFKITGLGNGSADAAAHVAGTIGSRLGKLRHQNI